jgi:hypothetical protein
MTRKTRDRQHHRMDEYLSQEGQVPRNRAGHVLEEMDKEYRRQLLTLKTITLRMSI